MNFPFLQILIFILQPVVQQVSTFQPATLASEHFWRGSVLIWAVCVGTMK